MRQFSRRAATLGTVAVLAAGGAVAAVPASAQASPRTPTCTTADLRLSIGRVTGGAGSLFYPIRFRNASHHTCALRGYPGVSVLDSHGRQIGAAASRNPHPVTTVSVAPGRTVYATVRTNNRGLGAPCRAVSGYVRVYPPASYRPVLIPYRLQVCGSFDVNPVGRTA
ncbi:DUF4232 domain-containing protein [Streptacidiphilus monticola]|uniref:DUF4232 domain-containing protein n=1 Tax=Streptacidiphilus monticola TaxID=2161674 RepID=A0ABW1GCX2_9ACTN